MCAHRRLLTGNNRWVSQSVGWRPVCVRIRFSARPSVQLFRAFHTSANRSGRINGRARQQTGHRKLANLQVRCQVDRCLHNNAECADAANRLHSLSVTTMIKREPTRRRAEAFRISVCALSQCVPDSSTSNNRLGELLITIVGGCLATMNKGTRSGEQ